MKRHIPNLLTMGNLFCGCCALLYILNGQQETAAWLTLACFVFDYLDGMVARALGVSSPLGKELDSLADVVSFGVVPGAMLYMLLCHALGTTDGVTTMALPAFVLSGFAGLRLGKFNLDTRQTNYFIGLSTPATTVFVLGLALAAEHDRFGMRDLLSNIWLLYGVIGLLAYLLVSEIPMFGMKIKSSSLRDNSLNLGFVALLVILACLLKELALSAIVVSYIVVSIFSKKMIV